MLTVRESPVGADRDVGPIYREKQSAVEGRNHNFWTDYKS